MPKIPTFIYVYAIYIYVNACVRACVCTIYIYVNACVRACVCVCERERDCECEYKYMCVCVYACMLTTPWLIQIQLPKTTTLLLLGLLSAMP